MTARKRASATATTTAAAADSRPAQADHKSPESTSSDLPIVPPKWGVIVKLSLLFPIPYFLPPLLPLQDRTRVEEIDPYQCWTQSCRLLCYSQDDTCGF
ncbi:hypothetical protein SLEP1_g56759 [Rubroshorea leprosula]|uniref:Uncharacterized protein n=1 Tax=Rubroshorea leprosula TaxID=152421 RepID=A0AAV5MJP7_9ROSI|nr:hypothetical protein SLEP1_g56759 [Rubroshorea leprosula]